MNLLCAMGKRSRRRLFRVVVVLCTLVAVTYGMVAMPARSGGPDQYWIQWSNGALSNGGLCLDITGATYRRQTPLDLYQCNGQWNQSWVQKTTVFGHPEIQNPQSGLCVDDPDWVTVPGTQLQDQSCNAETAQRWRLPGYATVSTGTAPTVTGYGTVGSGLSGECMDAYGSSNGASPGQIVAINNCNENQAQDWTTWTDRTVRVWNLCMDTSSLAVGALVDLETCDGGLSQVWTQQSDGALLNGASGMCLDDPGANTTAGTRLDIFPCGGSPAQQWALPGTPPGLLRILPFGDSITYGIQSSTGGGYRCDLLSSLTPLGMKIQFVGSQVAGDCAQPDNEGHPGWTIEGLQSIENRTITGHEPNVVLLDAGTNDVNVNTPNVIVDGGDPTHAANALETLVTSIRKDAPGAVVVVGGLIPTPVAQTAANMTSFNQQVSAWISKQQGAGWHVGWADMSAVQVTDLADRLHPNDTGYQKMAAAWAAAINQALADGWVKPANAPAGPGEPQAGHRDARLRRRPEGHGVRPARSARGGRVRGRRSGDLALGRVP